MVFSYLRNLFPVTFNIFKAAKMPSNTNRIVWVDCEMTGLDANKDRLVELACIITEPDLNIVEEFGPIAINQPENVLEEMSDWCKSTFETNGLLERIKQSRISEAEAEQKFLEFILKHKNTEDKLPLGGNSVHADRVFLVKYMPKVMEHLHYRIIDVSSIGELIRRWYPEEALKNMPEKAKNHLALDDIRESIQELQFYRDNFFR